MSDLENYSEQLYVALQSNTNKFSDFKTDSSGKIKHVKITIEELWLDGDFYSALTKAKEVSLFILRNRQHPAITLWNQKKS